MQVLANIDVPDLTAGETFYVATFGLTVSRRFGSVIELTGGGVLIHLLEKSAGTTGAAASPRDYHRHWTPVHLDFVVDDLAAALDRAVAAGATVEQPAVTRVWGRIAMLADPFGHGFCLIQMLGRGYDEIAAP